MLNIHWATKVTKAGIGGASIEAEFIDSVSQERIAALVDNRQGRGLQHRAPPPGERRIHRVGILEPERRDEKKYAG